MEHWVSFPGLGLNNIPVAQSVAEFTVFGIHIDIRFYGLLITIGLVLAFIYAYKQAPRLGIDRDRMMDVVLVSFVAAIICTRLYYVFFSDPAYYFAHPEKIIAIWDGGLAIYGGIIGAFVTGFIMCRIRKVNALALFDLAAVGFLIGQGLGRWGNFFNQEAHGGATALPWGMTGDIIGDVPVHPTFLYESLWCLLGVLVLHIMFKKCYRFNGQLFASYLIWYGIERLFVEGLRTDSLYIPGTELRISQLVSVAAIIVGVVLMIVLYRLFKKAQPTLEEIEDEIGDPETFSIEEETKVTSDEADEIMKEDNNDGKDH